MGEFVCVQCGDKYATTIELERHWDAEGHGPDSVRQSQLDRARQSVRPIESAMVQRRRGVTRITRRH